MKNLLLLSLLLVTNVATAQSHAKGIGTVTSVEISYINVNSKVENNVCNPVQVPIYGNANGNGNQIIGAIIGGAVGSRFGGGDGKTAATVIGAIAGSEMSRNSGRDIVGYQTEQRCFTEVKYLTEKVGNGFIVNYEFNGYELRTTSTHPYNIGDKIELNLQVFPMR